VSCEFLEFCCFVINEFGNLVFGLFELCCFVISEFGVCALGFSMGMSEIQMPKH
jgi:hypothetical protein